MNNPTDNDTLDLVTSAIKALGGTANIGQLAEHLGWKVTDTRKLANQMVNDNMLEIGDKVEGKKGYRVSENDDGEPPEASDDAAREQDDTAPDAPIAGHGNSEPASATKAQRNATTRDAFKILAAYDLAESDDEKTAYVEKTIEGMPEHIRNGAIKKAMTKCDASAAIGDVLKAMSDKFPATKKQNARRGSVTDGYSTSIKVRKTAQGERGELIVRFPVEFAALGLMFDVVRNDEDGSFLLKPQAEQSA